MMGGLGRNQQLGQRLGQCGDGELLLLAEDGAHSV